MRLLRERDRELALGDRALLEERLAHAAAARLDLFERALELVDGDRAVRQQQRAEGDALLCLGNLEPQDVVEVSQPTAYRP